jgi:hypothetical protein
MTDLHEYDGGNLIAKFAHERFPAYISLKKRYALHIAHVGKCEIVR